MVSSAHMVHQRKRLEKKFCLNKLQLVCAKIHALKSKPGSLEPKN